MKYNCTIFFESNVLVITARKRSLGQGNVFTPVCQSFCSQGGVHPRADTPQADTPGRQLEPEVRILLEWILIYMFSNADVHCKTPIRNLWNYRKCQIRLMFLQGESVLVVCSALKNCTVHVPHQMGPSLGNSGIVSSMELLFMQADFFNHTPFFSPLKS